MQHSVLFSCRNVEAFDRAVQNKTKHMDCLLVSITESCLSICIESTDCDHCLPLTWCSSILDYKASQSGALWTSLVSSLWPLQQVLLPNRYQVPFCSSPCLLTAHLLVCFPPLYAHPCFNETPCLHYIIHITHCLVAFKSPRLDSNFFRGQAKNLLRQIGGGEITTRKCEIYPVWIFRNNMMSLIMSHWKERIVFIL